MLTTRGAESLARTVTLCRFMRVMIAILLIASLGAAMSADSGFEKDSTSAVVAHIMRTLEKGSILVTPPPNQPVAFTGGWEMPFPGGKSIGRWDLQLQCTAITPYGWRAVPELLKWLDHKDGFMRYIAANSLEEITGVHPTFYYFGTPHKAFNGNRDWFEKAKTEWSNWYEDLANKKKPDA